MKLQVVTYTGVDTGREVILPEAVFGVTPNDHAIYLDVKQILAHRRQGTHKTKEKSEITGSTRKIKKQKGTGTARAGSIKSPIFRGGGRVFGPMPRAYGFKLNKKTKQLARKSALVYKAQEAAITVLETFSFASPKTKDYVAMLNSLEVGAMKTLLVLADVDKHIVLAGRNLKQAKVGLASCLNTYDILNASRLLISENALAVITENLA